MPEVTCTWVGCSATASVVVKDRNGKPWANLCKAHDDQMNKHITDGDVRGILSDWVKAGGGAEKLAERL